MLSIECFIFLQALFDYNNFFFRIFVLFTARNSIRIYLNSNGHARGKCTTSYSSKRKATFNTNIDNVICYQIQPDNDSYSMTNSHIISSKKLSVGLRR